VGSKCQVGGIGIIDFLAESNIFGVLPMSQSDSSSNEIESPPNSLA
jgi:hypothetical protein